jgi:hypothetical protein
MKPRWTAAVILMFYALYAFGAGFKTYFLFFPEFEGFTAFSPEGSEIEFADHNLLISTRKYKNGGANFILSVYKGSELKALPEQRTGKGSVSRVGKMDGINIIFTENSSMNGCITAVPDGENFGGRTVFVMEYSGMDAASASVIIEKLT